VNVFQVKIAVYLLKHEADVNQSGYLTKTGISSSWTPLHLAAIRGYESLVRLMLELGADPSITKDNGNTPLMLAAGWGQLAAVQTILRHEAGRLTVDMQDNEFLRTALHMAVGGSSVPQEARKSLVMALLDA